MNEDRRVVPDALRQALRPVTVVAGHYGAGKTNFCVNLALDLAHEGKRVSVIDLDVVNPYFRVTEQRKLLEEHGVDLVAPVFAEAGTSLDVPSLTGRITPTIQDATEQRRVIIDAGGDDVGATALGRFALAVSQHDYAMLYVANRFRNLVADAGDALQNLREIEVASHLNATALVNNSHLKQLTTAQDIAEGQRYAHDLAERAALPIACTTVPENLTIGNIDKRYPIKSYVRSPWE